MSDLWRIQAQHATVCPRCLGYIDKGAWIVKEPGYSRWAHAVCPADLATRKHQPAREVKPCTRTTLEI